MAGYSKIYCIGGRGGFLGTDGINPIDLQIWVGDADRQWYEAHYFNTKLKPIGKINKIIPKAPDDKNVLLDCCIAFMPLYFEKCPSLNKIIEKLKTYSLLDFDINKNIPFEWQQLRKEAIQYFADIIIFEATLKEISHD